MADLVIVVLVILLAVFVVGWWRYVCLYDIARLELLVTKEAVAVLEHQRDLLLKQLSGS